MRRGDIIGYIGSTEENGGWAPHLHFAIYKNAPDGTYHYWGYAPNRSGDDVDLDAQGNAVGGFFTKPSAFISAYKGPPPGPTGSMNEPRVYHTATLLNDGTVLVTGGGSNTAELYDPSTGTWRYTAHPMNATRSESSAVKLADGRVLVIGGQGTYTAEIFDPATEQFTQTNPTNGQHHGRAPAFLLSDGRVMIVAGSYCYLDCANTTPEIYDPLTNSWSTTSSLPVGTSGVAAVMLQDETVLVFGGYMDYIGTAYPYVQAYNPLTSATRAMANMLGIRAVHTATLLPNNKILIAGGYDSTYYTTKSTEIYDPLVAPNGSTQPGNPLQDSRRDHTATLLPNGNVLVVGGNQGRVGVSYDAFPPSVELFNYATGTWSVAGMLSVPRFFHTATLLRNGRVLIVGGFLDSNYTRTATAEIWEEPSPDTITITSNPSGAGFTLIQPGLRQPIIASTPFTLTNAVPGDYTVTWNILLGNYATPASQTKTLMAGGAISFFGDYSVPPPPQSVFSDDTGTGSFADSTVSNSRTEGSTRKDDIRVQNYVRLCLGMLHIILHLLG